jgi:hypothetical protein
VIATSSTVWENLSYLIGAVVLAAVGGFLVWLRHRQPKSVESNMASFRRGLSALAPDEVPDRVRRPSSAAPRKAPSGLTHVRIDPVAARQHYRPDVDETSGEQSGGHTG